MRQSLADLSTAELEALYDRRECSPVEVLDAVLDRLADTDGQIHSVVTVDSARARLEAHRQETVLVEGQAPRPPLFGVPVTVKDLLATEGLVTTRGSRCFEHWVPSFDAVAVERLRASGAIVVAKTNTSEGGWKADTDNPVFGPTTNPWDPALSPGGSSGGAAAAVALGIGPIALGTDGAGSIRIPSSFCGVVGMKPSFGLVPYFPASAELLSHVGPLGRRVGDVAAALDVMAGGDERDPFSWGLPHPGFGSALERAPSGLRIAVIRQVGDVEVDGEILAGLDLAARALEGQGHYLEEVTALPDPYPSVEVILSAAEAAGDEARLTQDRAMLDPGRVAVIERGLSLRAVDLATAEEQRFAYAASLRRILGGFDLLISPTVAVRAFPAGAGGPPGSSDVVERLAWAAFSYPFNLTGWPAISLPLATSAAGLPVGVQLVGTWHADGLVLRIARQLELACPWQDSYQSLVDRRRLPAAAAPR